MTDNVADNAPAGDTAQGGGGHADNAPANNQVTPEAQAQPSDAFSIPDAYKEKGWAKNIKTHEDLWKSHDAAQDLIGKKRVAPDHSSASEQELQEYYNGLRPQDVKEYQFGDEVPEGQREIYAKMLHDSGLSKFQADKLIKSFMAHEGQMREQLFDKGGFEAEMKKSFGDGFEKRAGEIALNLKGMISTEDQQALDAMPNQYLGLFYRVAGKYMETYGASEGGQGASGGGGAAPQVDVEKEQAEIRNQIHELSKRQHTAEEKQVLIDRLHATYKPKGR